MSNNEMKIMNLNVNDIENEKNVIYKGDYVFIMNYNEDNKKCYCDFSVYVSFQGETDIKDPIIIRLADDKNEIFPGSYIVSSCCDIKYFMPLREYNENHEPIYSTPEEMIEEEYKKLRIVSNWDNLDKYFSYQYC